MNPTDSYSIMNEQDFPWDLVRSFLAALEHGSLMGAARATGMSQPTLGRHIAELEAHWRLVLFERTGRGLAPTEDALRLADAARDMALQAARLGRLASGSERGAQGRVRLAASQPVACELLPPILARMRAAYPDIEIELVVSNSLANLLRREADIALRMVRPEQSSLVARRIAEIPIQACAHRDYIARRGAPESAGELLQHDLITGDQHDEVVPALAAHGFPTERLRFGLRSDDLIAQWAAVRNGMGVGFAASYLVRAYPDVHPLLPRLPLPRFPVWLTVHRELRTSARIRAVYDYLAEAVPAALAEA